MTPSELWMWLQRKQQIDADKGARLRKEGLLIPLEQEYRGADDLRPAMEMMPLYQEPTGLQEAKENAMRNPIIPGFFNRTTQPSSGYRATQPDQSDLPGDYGVWGAAAARRRKWLQ